VTARRVPGPSRYWSGDERPVNVAILLSTTSFEEHYVRGHGLDREEYVERWRGGWVWSYCRMLQREGVIPHVYIASLGETGIYETPEGYRIRFLPIGHPYRAWSGAAVLKRTPYGRYATCLVNGRSVVSALRRALVEDDLAVLAFQEYWPSRYDYLAKRLDRPFIAIDQGYVGDREIKLAKRRTLPLAREIVTMTEYEARRLRGYGARAQRIPNAIDADFWSPTPMEAAGDDRTVVYVAQLNDSHKRTSDLIRAVAILGEDWRLELVGWGPDREMLEALASELGVSARVTFRGFIRDKEKIRALVRHAGVFALPSAREGLPIALLEAMAVGSAVVCTDIPAMAEVVTDGEDGRVVPVARPDRLADAIRDAFQQRERLGAAARATIERDYTESSIGRRLAAVLRRAAGDTSSDQPMDAAATPPRATLVSK
jgi:glycosyltransferase involved in cell wall biosynthesis